MSVVKDVEIQHQGLVFRMQIKLISVGQVPPPPPPEQTITELKIVKVTTSGDDGNVGNNMLSDNADRWSCKGKTCTATFDLGGVQQVGEMFIRFHRDAERTESFEISLSEDGQNYLGKLTGEQQGQGGVVLSITPFFNARYVRFVGQGNNVNEWNSIEYVKISGKKLVEPEPEPEPCPPGQHRDSSGNCVPDTEPGPTPEPGELEDGVKMLYPKIGNAVTFTYGSSNEGRAQWRAPHPCFLNEETTVYMKIDKITDEGEEVSIKMRGGSHSDSDPQMGCCYIVGIGYNSNINNQYECPHPSNHAMSLHEKAGLFNPGTIIGKWFGIKALVYQEGDHDKLECWLDMDGLKADGTPANNWKKFWENTSKEFFGKCNGKDKNLTLLRCDEIEGAPENPAMSIKFGSVRQIVVGPSASGDMQKAIEDTKKVAELANDPKEKKAAKETLKKSKKT